MRRFVIFVLAYVTWCLLSWPYEPGAGWDYQVLLVGVAAAALVAGIFSNAVTRRPMRMLNPVRWFWAICYVPLFAYYCVKANLQVAYLVLHPAMPIRPGIVKVHTTLRSPAAITALANSITLTPGTLTVDADEEGNLYVHWIDVETAEEDEATEEIVRRFEGMLARIFE
ncbi:MAG: Na+/H+ antiporter subunit E [Planctomycetota bacterium]